MNAKQVVWKIIGGLAVATLIAVVLVAAVATTLAGE